MIGRNIEPRYCYPDATGVTLPPTVHGVHGATNGPRFGVASALRGRRDVTTERCPFPGSPNVARNRRERVECHPAWDDATNEQDVAHKGATLQARRHDGDATTERSRTPKDYERTKDST